MRRSMIFRTTVLALATAAVWLSPAADAGEDPWRDVRRATARYHSFQAAEADGYTVAGEPCVESPEGVMGIHAINPPLMADAAIDPLQPEIVLYVPKRNGKLRAVGLEYWKADADGDLSTDEDRPSLFGQPFDGPMPGHNPGMPVHYDLHVWLFEENPSGFFAAFNPELSCAPSRGDDDDDGTGRIAFLSLRTGTEEIWVMNDDGTNPVQLTNNPGNDIFPAWSPDGRRIAFGSQVVPGDRTSTEIFVMNADGTQQTRLTFNAMNDVQPTWSPDGKKIAFRRLDPGFNGEIYVMNANGTGERNLTNNPAFDGGPDWSPDGKRIAFDSDRSASGASAVYTMRPDGMDVRKLTDDSLDAFGPDWSPDGKKIAFADHGTMPVESDLFVMKADGTGVRQLFETAQNEGGATWSPDGKRIAFDRFLLSDGEFVPGSGEIYSVRKDGSGLTNLTNFPGADDEHPDWAPGQDDD